MRDPVVSCLGVLLLLSRVTDTLVHISSHAARCYTAVRTEVREIGVQGRRFLTALRLRTLFASTTSCCTTSMCCSHVYF
ncbi:hypothetical protein PR001_g18722 [Phytophthora rubi]|uniref:Secreted protein n=1 Tax=Phytophthora rubi TaxID=129364 RepID=A0A6A3K9U1_9STRA|nr:hypothetical protein PR001_g18722 [Phytophthora rubi]